MPANPPVIKIKTAAISVMIDVLNNGTDVCNSFMKLTCTAPDAKANPANTINPIVRPFSKTAILPQTNASDHPRIRALNNFALSSGDVSQNITPTARPAAAPANSHVLDKFHDRWMVLFGFGTTEPDCKNNVALNKPCNTK